MTEEEYNRRRYLPRQLKLARQKVRRLHRRKQRLPDQIDAATRKVKILENEAEHFGMAQHLRCYGDEL